MSRLLEIGERLAVAREKVGYSQEAFAEKMGCCTITVSRWENGHTSMKATDLICAAQALGVSVDYLLGVSKPEAQFEYRAEKVCNECGVCDSGKCVRGGRRRERVL